jgi:hypothetical protein
MLVILGTLVLINIAGAPYYVLPMAERVRSPLHYWLRPSGPIGQSAGVLALLIFCFLWLYPLRKRYKWLSFTGPVPRWLDVHILAAIGIPLILTVHAAWRFEGLIGLGFGAMLVVWTSGIVGRYLYVRIPRRRTGVESSRDEVAAERRSLVTEIAAAAGIDPFDVEKALSPPARGAGNSTWRVMAGFISDDLARRRVRAKFSRLLAQVDNEKLDSRAMERILRLATRQIALSQQLRALDATQKLFRLWHVAHRPFAVTALLAVLVHVAVVVALGVTWFW